jgi:hypothetical protein
MSKHKQFFFAMPNTSSSKDIIAIISSVAAAHRDNLKVDVDQLDPTGTEEEFWIREVLDLIRNVVLQDDASAAQELITESLPPLFDSDYGYCLNYDIEGRILSGTSQYRTVEFRQSVSAGILGFVALTGRPVRVACLEDDPRYLPSADDLGGGERARLLARAVQDVQGRTLAILALVRAASKPAFSEQDEKALSLLAQYLAAPLERFKLESQLEAASRHLQETMPVRAGVYRTEAVEHYAGSVQTTGEILRLTPKWTRWVYWLLLLCIGAALLYSTLTKATEYADGPAVILFSGYIHGVVPVACRAQAADKAQQSNPIAASALRGEGRPSLIAFIPGKYRPELRPGMSLRLKLSSFQYADQKLTVDCIGEQVVSPAQVKRYLPADSAYSVSLSGPVVPVFATLPSDTFEANGRRYAYYDGMGATAEVATSSERLIFALVPGLKHWLNRNGG